MKRKWSFFTASLLLASSLLGGCYGNSKPTTTPQAGTNNPTTTTTPEDKQNGPQVLNITSSEEIATMNTLGSINVPATRVQNTVFEGLYRLGPDNQPVPGMAESHEMSPDGKTYTFHLRKNAQWSNGTPVTAHDFVYAWKKAIHPDTQSIYSYIMMDIKNAVAIQDKKSPLFKQIDQLGVTAVDDHTLKVELDNPIPYFVSLTTYAPFFPQNEAFVKAQGDKYALEVENLIFNGPFVLDSWQHEQGYVFKKNGNYWDKDSVKLDQINVKIVKDTTTAVNLYEAGEIDYTYVTSDFVDQYKNNQEFSTFLESNDYFMRFNHKNQYLKNVNIRKAIDMAWDKEGLTNVILNNGSVPAYFLVPKGLAKGPDGKDFRDSNGDFNKTDVAKAQELWKKGLSELGTSNVSLEILTYDTEVSKKIIEYIKNQLEKNLPGLTLTINTQPNKQKLKLEEQVQYDIDYGGWTPDYQDPMTYIDLFVTDGPYNQSHYSNPKLDELVKKAKTTVDPKARWQLMLEAEKLMMEDAVIAPVYQRGSARLVRPYVKGLVDHSFGTDVSFKWVYIEGKK